MIQFLTTEVSDKRIEERKLISMLYQGWKDTIGQPTVYQHGRRNQITEANSKPGSNKVLDKNFP